MKRKRSQIQFSAFNRYSVGGIQAGSVLGHFNLYISNHEAYLADLEGD
jgi:hypothetical protein